MKVGAIIQARVTSSRFPNKILEKIKGKTLVEILFKRIKKSKKINNIIFAIPKNHKQKKLKKILKSIGCDIYEGSEDDVLDRYYRAAKKYKLDLVVRLTADGPLYDPMLIDQIIDEAIKKNYDFVSNIYPPSFPDGLDCSVIKLKALKIAWNRATKKSDREHIVGFFKNNKKFKKSNISHTEDLSNCRWTIDEPEDLVVLKNIFSNFKNLNFSWLDVLQLMKKKPNLFTPNQHIKRDEGADMLLGQKLWRRAKRIIPGGNMMFSKNPDYLLPSKWPAYYQKAKGCEIWDLENNKFYDLCLMGVGTNILGYSNSAIDNAVIESVKKSNVSSLNCFEEIELCERLVALHPWSKMAKLARTGGEANSIAIRLARAASGKDKIAFCGYHGWHDWYLSANLLNSKNLDQHLIPGLNPKGVPKSLIGSTIPFKYNDFDALEKIAQDNELGVIIMEVTRNERPKDNFLQKIRKLADKKNIVLIFDECTSGFRENFGGIHLQYGVDPDMAMFGKALGNGYAITAVIGKKEIMENAQETFNSSTFWTERSGPVAALKTLDLMEKIKSWEIISKNGKLIKKKWEKLADKNKLKINIQGIPAIINFSITSSDWLKYKTLISQEMLKKGFLAGNIVYSTTKHSPSILTKYFESLESVFEKISKCEKGYSIDRYLETEVCQSGFKRLN